MGMHLVPKEKKEKKDFRGGEGGRGLGQVTPHSEGQDEGPLFQNALLQWCYPTHKPTKKNPLEFIKFGVI
jgi:hypothetical protein